MNENEYENNVETTPEVPQEEVVESCECVEAPQQKKNLLPIFGIAAAAVVAVIVVLSILLSTPWMLVTSGFKHSASALNKNKTIALLNDVANGGSMEEVVDLGVLSDQVGMDLEGTVSVKSYMDLSKSTMAMAISYKDDNSEILDASLRMNKENIAISSGTLLDGNAYGISLKDFVKNLEDSEFGPDGKYYIGDEIYDVLKRIDLNELEALEKDTEKLLKSISKKLAKELKDNSTVEKENTSLSFGDKDTKVTAVNIEMDDGQIFAVLDEMVDYLRKDKQLKTYLNEHGDTLLDGIDGMDADENIDAFYESLDELHDEMDSLEEELEESEVKLDVTVYVTKLTRQAVGMEVRVKESGETITKVALLAGPNLKNTKEIRFSIDDDKAVYEVTTDDKDLFEAKVDISDVGSGKLSYEKDSGEFKLQFKDDYDEEIKITGTIQKAKNEVSVSVDKVTVDGQSVELGMSIIFRAKDDMPAMPAYTEVLKMDASELEGLVEDVMTAVQDLAADYI